MEHYLKIYPEYYEAVASKDKPFEVRKNDRNYKVGDKLILREGYGRFTGRYITADVSYILDKQPFCPKGYVILGLKNIRDGFDVTMATL